MGIIDKNFELDNKFKAIFKYCTGEISNILSDLVNSNKADKEILTLARYI